MTQESFCYSSKALDTATRQYVNQESQSANVEQQMSLRSRICKFIENDFLRLLVWMGPIFQQQRRINRKQLSDTKCNNGYGITMAAAIDFYCPLRIEFAVYLLKSWLEPTVTFSINWSLSCPRIVCREDDTFKVALSGDVGAMQEKFSRGCSKPNDTLLDGWTLLHVCKIGFTSLRRV